MVRKEYRTCSTGSLPPIPSPAAPGRRLGSGRRKTVTVHARRRPAFFPPAGPGARIAACGAAAGA